MTGIDETIKKVYDHTARTITMLHFRGGFSEKEMLFLLNLLDAITIGKAPELRRVIAQWQNCSLDEEIDEIIRATLLNIDFSDDSSVQKSTQIINELLYYK